jgi:phage baseplate assembly protein W
MLPMGSMIRRLLNQSIHPSVAHSTSSTDFQALRLWMSSALYRPLMVSARALS